MHWKETRMTHPRRFLLLALAALLLGGSPASAQKEKGKKEAVKHLVDEKLFESLTWREVGPYRGGRSAAVTGVPSQPNVYYFGATVDKIAFTQQASGVVSTYC
jgi:hypothetical protein